MMGLIDWPELALNALWIAGAVVALAVVSIGQWEARMQEVRLRTWLGRPAAQRALTLAAVLFCLGMLGTSGSVLERVLWGALAAVFTLQALAAVVVRQRRAARPSACSGRSTHHDLSS
jgi:hypothetical protein